MIPRAVVDPNVFVSAQVSSLGHPARIARAAGNGDFELIVSERLLAELRDVLLRPRFRRYMPEGEVEDLISDLREVGIAVQEGDIGRIVPEDPKDDYLVALAREAEADYLVSGDPHLTSLGGEVGVQVLTPRTFCGVLVEQGG